MAACALDSAATLLVMGRDAYSQHIRREALARTFRELDAHFSSERRNGFAGNIIELWEARRKAFIRKWRLQHRAVDDSLWKAGERLFASTRTCRWRTLSRTAIVAGWGTDQQLAEGRRGWLRATTASDCALEDLVAASGHYVVDDRLRLLLTDADRA